MSADRYSELEAQVLRFMQSGDASDDSFNALALDLFEFQFANNMPFAAFCRHHGIGGRPDHWWEIPAVPTASFKLPEMPQRCFGEDEIVATFWTSGTTGEVRGRHDFRSLKLYDESVRRGWKRIECPDLPKLVLTQSPEAEPGSSLVHMMQVLGGRFFIDRAGAFDRKGLNAALKRARGPVLLMGTALALLRLSEEGPLPLPDGSWLFETGGYKGTRLSRSKEELYGVFSAAYQLPVDNMINEYSMTELSSQFYTTGLENAHTGPPWIRARVLDAESRSDAPAGSRGYLQFLDLANAGSAIAVRTQDLATRINDTSFHLHGRDPAALPRGVRAAPMK